MRRALALLTSITLLGIAAAAHANGSATPDTAAFHPESPASGNWVMNTTFGFLFSNDAGASWHWSCHEAVIGTVAATPKSWRSPTGTLFVTSPLGLAIDPTMSVYRTTDGACSWNPIASLQSDGVIALAFDSLGSKVVAAGSDAGAATAEAWISSDGGATFYGPVVTRAGGAPRFFVSAAVAPSDSQRIYLTYEALSPGTASVLRSDDGGVSWNEYSFPYVGQPATKILAVSPANPDVVWLRNDASSDRVLVSTNGAQSFSLRYTTNAIDVAGFGLTNGGSDAWLAVRSTTGLFAAAGAGAFVQQSLAVNPRCLATKGNDLFVCASPYTDPWPGGHSTGGATWTTAMSFARVLGPISCGGGATSPAICDGIWPGIDAKIHGTATPTPSPTPTPGNGGNGGGGCGCDLGGSTPPLAAGALAALALALARRRARA